MSKFYAKLGCEEEPHNPCVGLAFEEVGVRMQLTLKEDLVVCVAIHYPIPGTSHQLHITVDPLDTTLSIGGNTLSKGPAPGFDYGIDSLINSLCGHIVQLSKYRSSVV